MELDVSTHRNARKYSMGELVGRVIWAAVRPLFFLSPRLLYGWRNTLLRLFGARIGRGVRIYPTVSIFVPWGLQIEDEATIGHRVIIYNVGSIRIGARTMISQNAHICAGSHDYRSPGLPLLKTPIEIGSDVWICADAFVGPGVTVGESAVVGARSALFRDVAEQTVVGGNPAQFIKFRHTNVRSDGRATA
jgi:putative colanic acid biosynthesis acetyltransferase WcaF